MEPHILNKLAEKFWQGECTSSEEQQLKTELSSGDIPKGHEALAQYIRFLEQEKNSMILDDNFDSEVLSKISSDSKSNGIRSFFRIAAMFILIAGLSWFAIDRYQQSSLQQTSEFVDTFQNSEQAYLEVRKAMMMVSSEMNYGVEQTGKLSKFNKVKEDLGIKN